MLAQPLLDPAPVLSVRQFVLDLFCSEKLRDAELSRGWEGGWGPCLPFKASHKGEQAIVISIEALSNTERSDRQYTVQDVKAQGGVALHQELN